MALNKGWLERRKDGRVVSVVEVFFHRALIKKIPRQKGTKMRVPTKNGEDSYYLLDKKVNLGELGLVGNAVFNNNEIVVVQMTVAHFRMPLRLLGKISHVTSFVEYKRLVFEGNVQFSAVHKGDFDQLLIMDEQKRQRTVPLPPRPKSDSGSSKKMTINFKKKP